MPLEDLDRENDAFAAALVGYDEQLRSDGAAPLPDDTPRLADAARVIQALEALWPRPKSVRVPPNRVGRFQIVPELGRGPAGIVYLAEDAALRRQVAVKVPNPDAHTELRHRFLREAQAAAALRHPNIVPILEVGDSEGAPYIVFEYCVGTTLAEHLRARGAPLDPATAADWTASLADALAHAHEQGVVHRDLKPANVILDESPSSSRIVPRIADFGLAKIADLDETSTQTGHLLGTPAYMAPEQARGDKDNVGPSSDQFALGVLFYESLTGKRPFVGASVLDMLEKIRHDDPTPLRRVWAEIPADLETICLKSLEKIPGRRYATCSEMRDDLRRWRAGVPVLARPIGPWRRAVMWMRRKPFQFATAALAVLFFVVVLPAFLAMNWLLARSQADQADWELRASQERQRTNEAKRAAATADELLRQQQYFSLVASIRQRSAARKIGWTASVLEDLQKAAQIDTAARDPAELSGLAVSALTSFDLIHERTLLPNETSSYLAFSPDSRILAACPWRSYGWFVCTVTLVDVESGKTVAKYDFPPSAAFQLSGRPDGALKMLFSPDGRWLAIGCRSGRLHVWDLHAKQPKAISWDGHRSEIHELLFHPSRPEFFTAGGGALKRWDLPKAPRLLSEMKFRPVDAWFAFEQGDEVITFTEDKQRFHVTADLLGPWKRQAVNKPYWDQPIWLGGKTALFCRNEYAALADGYEGEVLAKFSEDGRSPSHLRSITTTAVHPSKGLVSTISSGRADRFVKFWETSNAKFAGKLFVGGSDAQVDVAFSPDGKRFAVTDDRKIELYRVTGLAHKSELGPQARTVVSADFSEAGSSVVCFGCDYGLLNAEVAKWDAKTKRRAERIDVPVTIQYPYLGTQPDGNVVALHADMGAIQVHQPIGTKANQVEVGWCGPVAVTGRGTIFALADRPRTPQTNRSVMAWPSEERNKPRQWNLSGGVKLTGRESLSSICGGVTGVLVGNGEGRIEYLTENGPKTALKLPGGAVNAIGLGDEDHIAVVGMENGAFHLVSVISGKIVQTFDESKVGTASVAISRNGNVAACGTTDGTVSLYRVDGGVWRRFLAWQEVGPPRSVSLNADGSQLLLVRERNYSAQLFDVPGLEAEARRLVGR